MLLVDHDFELQLRGRLLPLGHPSLVLGAAGLGVRVARGEGVGGPDRLRVGGGLAVAGVGRGSTGPGGASPATVARRPARKLSV